MCGLCDTKVCAKCHEIKSSKKENHVCDPDVVKTMDAIKKECNFKIDGCFGKDVPIYMWNGSIKMSDTIESGD